MVVGFVAIMFLASFAVEVIDLDRQGQGGNSLKLALILEGTSHLATLLVVPAVLWFDSFFPSP